jgi:hypothetical protein
VDELFGHALSGGAPQAGRQVPVAKA